MFNVICNIKSPIKLSKEKVSIIPPLSYDKRIYILHDKKLYFVLIKINKMSEYLQFVRDEGYENTLRWLNMNHLLGHEFLENVSRYWFDIDEFNSNYKYEEFSKDNNHKPVVSERFWNEYFCHVLIYETIAAYREEFDIFVKSRLDVVSVELKNLENSSNLEVRKNFYRNNIYNHLINNFFDYKNINIKSRIRDIDFRITSKISDNSLCLYKIGGLAGYGRCKFLMKDVKYFECIKNGTVVNFQLADNLYDFKFFMNKSKKFVEEKICFEKKYILRILEKSSLRKTNKADNRLYQFYVDKLFSKIMPCNIVFLEDSDYDCAIVLMNLKTDTVEMLNNLLYENKNDIYSLVVKTTDGSSMPDIMSSGYAYVDCL